MDKITLLKSGTVFTSRFAAPSVSSGRFVAAIIDSDVETVRAAFDDPCPMLVHNMEGLYADKVYTGFHGIRKIMENGSEVTVIIEKEDS